MIIKCQTCNKEYHIDPSRLKIGGGKYCSKECFNNRKTTSIKTNCLTCGKDFFINAAKTKIEQGKYCSRECRNIAMEKRVGNLSPNWRGGLSFIPYCEKFNPDFKERTRAYWGYICFECGTAQNGKRLAVHHIHYDKKMCCNGSPRDVVPLCQSCHAKTNDNREYWEDHFTYLLYAWCPDGKCYFTKEEMIAYKG
jgi:hypothetical protein